MRDAYDQHGPLSITSGPQFFLDDFFMDSISGLDRELCQPTRGKGPILAHTSQNYHYQPFFTVQGPPSAGSPPLPGQSADSERFRYWGGVRIRWGGPGGMESEKGVRHAYAESADGMHWTLPDLGLVDVEGWKNNNLLPTHALGGTGYPASVIDNGPDHTDPHKRYMMITYKGITDKTGAWALYSPDGLHWTSERENPVVPYVWSYDKGPWSDGRQVYVDGVMAFHDKPRQKYVLFHVTVAQAEEGYIGRSRTGPIRRTVSQLESEDFVHWSKPRLILAPRMKTDMTEFYSMDAIHRNGLYIGFPRILHDDLPADQGGAVEGIGWTELAISRNGQDWKRIEGPFLDRQHQPYTWDHAMSWSIAPVYNGNRMLFYYAGYNQGHKSGMRQIGLAQSPTDRFMALSASDETGHFKSKRFKTNCRRVSLNAAVRGSLRLQFRALNGEPLSGFTFDECSAISGDAIAHSVEWQGRTMPANAAQRPLVLEARLERASLYAVNFEQ